MTQKIAIPLWHFRIGVSRDLKKGGFGAYQLCVAKKKEVKLWGRNNKSAEESMGLHCFSENNWFSYIYNL